MNDPLGIIGNLGATHRMPAAPIGKECPQGPDRPGFKQVLDDQISQVNRLQNDAKVAVEDLASGRRDDVESVMTATLKADMAFRMLLQVRNKVMEAYEEIKQIRI
jgi:flagellar hook-basal body complex protein FliE